MAQIDINKLPENLRLQYLQVLEEILKNLLESNIEDKYIAVKNLEGEIALIKYSKIIGKMVNCEIIAEIDDALIEKLS
jgi:hypothetical protein